MNRTRKPKWKWQVWTAAYGSLGLGYDEFIAYTKSEARAMAKRQYGKPLPPGTVTVKVEAVP